MKTIFRKFAERVSVAVGTPWAFFGAFSVILTWAASGPFFGFSTHWELVINSITTIATFLMVFVIQNTQNRDFKALQLKLDVLLLASRDTHPGLISLDNLKDEDLQRVEQALNEMRGQHGIEEVLSSLKRPPDSRERN